METNKYKSDFSFQFSFKLAGRKVRKNQIKINKGRGEEEVIGIKGINIIGEKITV